MARIHSIGWLIAIILAAAVFYLWFTQPSAIFTANLPPQVSVNRLRHYLNMDLRQIADSDQKDLHSVLRPLRPQKQGELDIEMDKPWYVWEYRTAQNKPAFLIFYGQKLWTIPGQSSATVYFLDETGALTNTINFPTGWRIDLNSAQWLYEPDLQCNCLDVRTQQSINGSDVARQVYAISNNQLSLVWIEDSKGTIRPQLYADRLGVPPTIQTDDDFKQALSSTRPLNVAEALWLLTNGDHAILKDPEIVAKIQDLSLSNNSKHKTLALLVLKSLKKPPCFLYTGEEE